MIGRSLLASAAALSFALAPTSSAFASSASSHEAAAKLSLTHALDNQNIASMRVGKKVGKTENAGNKSTALYMVLGLGVVAAGIAIAAAAGGGNGNGTPASP